MVVTCIVWSVAVGFLEMANFILLSVLVSIKSKKLIVLLIDVLIQKTKLRKNTQNRYQGISERKTNILAKYGMHLSNTVKTQLIKTT